jgi:uncharacterized protein (TIGR04255 family)
MTESPSLDTVLPEYRRPPIVEVAASIQFANIRELDTARLGLLWSRFRKDYPRAEQHPPLPNDSESFDPNKGGRVGFSFETSFPVPRLWFLSADGTRLVQVQSNRLVVNWRQLDSGESYPRYSVLREMLSESLSVFRTFLEEEKLGDLSPEQAELTYVNHIPAGERGSPRQPLSRYVQCWRGAPESSGLGPEEETSFRTQYVVRRSGIPVARLFVELDSAYTNTGHAPIYVLNMIARGAPDLPSVSGAFEFLDNAHRWIVTGFTHLTTDEAHKLWERNK